MSLNNNFVTSYKNTDATNQPHHSQLFHPHIITHGLTVLFFYLNFNVCVSAEIDAIFKVYFILKFIHTHTYTNRDSVLSQACQQQFVNVIGIYANDFMCIVWLEFLNELTQQQQQQQQQ